MNEFASKADPAVVAAWVEGWARSRGVSAPVPAHGGLRVEVGLPDQKARYVFADASPGVEAVSRAVAEPHVFIKVCAPPEAVKHLLASGWTIQPVGFLMVADDLYRAETSIADTYPCEVEAMPHGCVVTVHAQDGEIAASGRAFLAGSTAVFDQIVTHSDHRRRGLGRLVMSQLSAAAAQGGATKSCLVATPDGQAPYRTLGWRPHAVVTTAVRE